MLDRLPLEDVSNVCLNDNLTEHAVVPREAEKNQHILMTTNNPTDLSHENDQARKVEGPSFRIRKQLEEDKEKKMHVLVPYE